MLRRIIHALHGADFDGEAIAVELGQLALTPLSVPARVRVLNYLIERFITAPLRAEKEAADAKVDAEMKARSAALAVPPMDIQFRKGAN